MLPGNRIGCEHVIVKEIAPQQHARNAGAAVNQHAKRDQKQDGRFADDLARSLETENKRVKDEGGGKNHARLKATPGAEIAMKLDIEGENENEGNEQLGDNVRNNVLHAPEPGDAGAEAVTKEQVRIIPRVMAAALLAQNHDDGDTSGENNRYLAEGIIAAIACENRGNHIGHADFGRSFLNISRRDVGL